MLNLNISLLCTYVLNKSKSINAGAIATCWGYIYPIILCYLVVFFKDSQDPLHGISKLNFAIIISINQRKTEKFKDWFINGDEFNVLDVQQKKILMKFINLNDSNSDLDSSLYQNNSESNSRSGSEVVKGVEFTNN